MLFVRSLGLVWRGVRGDSRAPQRALAFRNGHRIATFPKSARAPATAPQDRTRVRRSAILPLGQPCHQPVSGASRYVDRVSQNDRIATPISSRLPSRNLGEPLNNWPFMRLLGLTSCGNRPVRRANPFKYAGAVSKNLNSEQFSSPIARALTAYVETRSLTRTFNNFAKPATVRQMSIRSRIRGPMVRIKLDANCGSSSRWRLRAPDLKAVSILFWTGRSRICTVSAHAAKHYGVTEDLYAMRVS